MYIPVSKRGCALATEWPPDAIDPERGSRARVRERSGCTEGERLNAGDTCLGADYTQC